MKKLIAITFCLGIIMSAIGLLMGGKFKLPNENFHSRQEKLQPFSQINIDIQCADVIIKKAEDYSIKLGYDENKYSFAYEVENGILSVTSKVKHKNHKWFGFNHDDDTNKLEINLPADYDKDTKIKIDADCSKINLYELRLVDSYIKSDVGDIKGENLKASNLKINSDVGNINLSGEFTGNTTFNTNVGKLKLECNEQSFDLSADLGRIKINGHDQKNNYVSNATGKNKITARSNIGDINIKTKP